MEGLKKPLSILSLVLAIVGLGLSIYLTYVHYNIDALVCGTGGCEIVQTSRYSEMFGVPIAVFGVVMFTALIIAIVLRERLPEHADMIGTGIVIVLLMAVLYWAYLSYLEANVIHAWCQWCVATSLVTLAFLFVESYRWYQSYSRIGA